jgi:hypothetical protein
MKLRRRSSSPPTRRQKLQTDDLAKPPSAFAYRAKRSEAERNTGRQPQGETSGTTSVASRNRIRSRQFWLHRTGLIILFLAVVISAVNVLSLSTEPKVMPLTSGSNQALLHSPTVYQDAASQLLKSSIWNRNKITVDTSSLSRQLLNKFPELGSVTVTIPLLAHRPLVYVQPVQPALVLVSSTGSFIIDTNGKALASSASSAALKQAQLPLLSDQSGLRIEPNRQALPATDISFIQTVIAQLSAKQFKVSNMTLPAAASEVDVHLLGQPYMVKFNLQSNDARGESGTFLATINQLRRQNVTPGQYIDVRVGGRAYYK